MKYLLCKCLLISSLLVGGFVNAFPSLSELAITPAGERNNAPEFVTENFHGGSASLADYKDKVVLLHFWATWCLPCREEMIGMEALWKKYKDQGFVVLTISHGTDTKEKVDTYLKAIDVSFPILLDEEGIVNKTYKVSRVPTTVLLDGNGKVISRFAGMREWESAEGMQLVEKLLSEK